MTLLWFVIWLISTLVGDSESLRFDPVNWWAGTFLLAMALDPAATTQLAPSSRARKEPEGVWRNHTPGQPRPRCRLNPCGRL